MDNILDQEEYAKNIYVIRHKLAELMKSPNQSHYSYRVGRFALSIFTYKIQDEPPVEPDSILRHKTVSIVLNETTVSGATSSVSIRDDSRFKNYEPIQYNIIKTPSGCVNISNGDAMPILHLCELIRYLHRLSNLTAFM
jgi:hypothetical protein